jgi:hypothetical protein
VKNLRCSCVEILAGINDVHSCFLTLMVGIFPGGFLVDGFEWLVNHSNDGQFYADLFSREVPSLFWNEWCGSGTLCEIVWKRTQDSLTLRDVRVNVHGSCEEEGGKRSFWNVVLRRTFTLRNVTHLLLFTSFPLQGSVLRKWVKTFFFERRVTL